MSIEEKMMLNDVVKTSDDTISGNTTIQTDTHNISREEDKVEEIKENVDNDIIYDINELDKIVVSKKADEVKVIVTLPYYVLKEFKQNVFRKFGSEINLNQELDLIIDNYGMNFGWQHHSTSSLRFNGKEPRKDVLLKLKNISEQFTFEESFPLLRRKQIESMLKEVLGNVDPRTNEKYLKCIKDFVEHTTNHELGYYDIWNLMGFRESVLEKLSNMESKRDKDITDKISSPSEIQSTHKNTPGEVSEDSEGRWT